MTVRGPSDLECTARPGHATLGRMRVPPVAPLRDDREGQVRGVASLRRPDAKHRPHGPIGRRRERGQHGGRSLARRDDIECLRALNGLGGLAS